MTYKHSIETHPNSYIELPCPCYWEIAGDTKDRSNSFPCKDVQIIQISSMSQSRPTGDGDGPALLGPLLGLCRNPGNCGTNPLTSQVPMFPLWEVIPTWSQRTAWPANVSSMACIHWNLIAPNLNRCFWIWQTQTQNDTVPSSDSTTVTMDAATAHLVGTAVERLDNAESQRFPVWLAPGNDRRSHVTTENCEELHKEIPAEGTKTEIRAFAVWQFELHFGL